MKEAVLLLAHGSPNSPEEIPEYLNNVTSGRALPPEVVAEIRHRYKQIGHSPLLEHTQAQARLVSERLGMPVYVGMRNWKPYIRDVVRQMQSDGFTRAAAICMAPQNSRTSVGLYRGAVLVETADEIQIEFVESWHNHPLLIRAFAEKLRAALGSQRSLPVIFTAHSVPERTILDGDAYAEQAQETASLVASAVPEVKLWRLAFQSQGASGGAWIGPSVEETILVLKRAGHNSILIQPVGFLCDHVEVLYDIDIAFKKFAREQEVELRRVESLNDSPALADALADLGRTALAKSSPEKMTAASESR